MLLSEVNPLCRKNSILFGPTGKWPTWRHFVETEMVYSGDLSAKQYKLYFRSIMKWSLNWRSSSVFYSLFMCCLLAIRLLESRLIDNPFCSSHPIFSWRLQTVMLRVPYATYVTYVFHVGSLASDGTLVCGGIYCIACDYINETIMIQLRMAFEQVMCIPQVQHLESYTM